MTTAINTTSPANYRLDCACRDCQQWRAARSVPQQYAYTCTNCGEGTNETHETIQGDNICGYCASNFYVAYCADCGRRDRYWGSFTECADGSDICEDCAASSRWRLCHDCGRPVSTRADYCPCEDDRHGDYCDCGDCYDYDGCDRLRDYSYRPQFVFHGDGPLYLGFELELETRYGRGMDDCLDTISQWLPPDLAYVKEDSSLNEGFELVTHPMSHAWASAHFPWHILSKLKSDGARDASSAGLHVHVNRTAFDGPCHIYRWLKLIYRNESDVIRIARRNSGQWAAFQSNYRKRIKDYAKGDYRAERYSAVNVQNADTFEVRVFASTLDEDELRASLDLVAASVEYTRTLTVREVVNGGWTWATFIAWVSERPEYAALARMAGALCAC